jgi:predicted DNA-binding transcriptional regulator AlpA
MNSRQAPRHINAVVAAFHARRPHRSATATAIFRHCGFIGGTSANSQWTSRSGTHGALPHGDHEAHRHRTHRPISNLLDPITELLSAALAGAVADVFKMASPRVSASARWVHLSSPRHSSPGFATEGFWECGAWDGAAHESGIPGAFLARCLGMVEFSSGPRPDRPPTAVSPSEVPTFQPISSTHAVGQVRGILAERVIISTMLDPFLTLKALVAYSGIGLRKLYEYLTDAEHPLPHYRVGGKIVVRRSEFDAWITAYRHIGRTDVAKIAESVLSGLRSS